MSFLSWSDNDERATIFANSCLFEDISFFSANSANSAVLANSGKLANSKASLILCSAIIALF